MYRKLVAVLLVFLIRLWILLHTKATLVTAMMCHSSYVSNDDSTLRQVIDLQGVGDAFGIGFLRPDLAIRVVGRIDLPFVGEDRRSFESFRLPQLGRQLLVDPLLLVLHADLAERALDVGDLVILALDLL